MSLFHVKNKKQSSSARSKKRFEKEISKKLHEFVTSFHEKVAQYSKMDLTEKEIQQNYDHHLNAYKIEWIIWAKKFGANPDAFGKYMELCK